MGVRRLLTAAPVDLKGKLITWMHLKNMHSSRSFKVKSDLMMECLMHSSISLFRATRGACNPNLQVVITHTSHVCSQHSFGLPLNLVPRVFGLSDQKARRLWVRDQLPLRMNGMHRTQFDHAPLDLLSLVISSHVFWLRKAQRWSKSVRKKRPIVGYRTLSPALCNLWLLLVE